MFTNFYLQIVFICNMKYCVYNFFFIAYLLKTKRSVHPESLLTSLTNKCLYRNRTWRFKRNKFKALICHTSKFFVQKHFSLSETQHTCLPSITTQQLSEVNRYKEAITCAFDQSHHSTALSAHNPYREYLRIKIHWKLDTVLHYWDVSLSSQTEYQNFTSI